MKAGDIHLPEVTCSRGWGAVYAFLLLKKELLIGTQGPAP